MGRKLDSDEIITLLEALIGECIPTGDAAINLYERSWNVKCVVDIVDWALECLVEAAECRFDKCRSAKDVGMTAYQALEKWGELIKKELGDI